MDCKCKGCEKRYPGCHAKCPDYAEFKKAVEAENEMRRRFVAREMLSLPMKPKRRRKLV